MSFAWFLLLLAFAETAAEVPGVQTTGLGGTCLATAWGSDAVYGNPAALARDPGPSLSVGWMGGVGPFAGPYASAAMAVEGIGVGAVGFLRRKINDEITLGCSRMVLERALGGHLAVGVSAKLVDGGEDGRGVATLVGVHSDVLSFVSVAAVCPFLQSGEYDIAQPVSVGLSLRWGEEFEWAADVDGAGAARIGAEIRPAGTGIRLRVGRGDTGATVGVGWTTGGVRVDAAAALDEEERLAASAGIAWFPGRTAP